MTRAHLDAKPPLLTDALLPQFSYFGFSYDLTKDEQAKEMLSAIAGRRVPAEMMPKTSRSTVTGEVQEDHFNFGVQVYLQDPDPKSHLTCYEVEMFSPEGQKNIPQTTELVPESLWQEEENHYCMIGEDGFPLIPVDLARAGRFSFGIRSKASLSIVADLMRGLPLSTHEDNVWFAGRTFSNGKMEILFNPAWEENNLALVYNLTSKKRITPAHIKELTGELLQTLNLTNVRIV